MTIQPDLFKAILAMDVYNRGYDASIDLGETDTQGNFLSVGNATIYDSLGDANAQAIGFYALAYTYDSGTIISYRGTDYPENDNPIPKDIEHGWTLGAGLLSSEQSLMAIDFYKSVAEQFELPGSDNIYLDANIALTGHSLGGELAGLVAANDNYQEIRTVA